MGAVKSRVLSKSDAKRQEKPSQRYNLAASEWVICKSGRHGAKRHRMRKRTARRRKAPHTARDGVMPGDAGKKEEKAPCHDFFSKEAGERGNGLSVHTGKRTAENGAGFRKPALTVLPVPW